MRFRARVLRPRRISSIPCEIRRGSIRIGGRKGATTRGRNYIRKLREADCEALCKQRPATLCRINCARNEESEYPTMARYLFQDSNAHECFMECYSSLCSLGSTVLYTHL